jgi:hypothetical protein
MKEWVTLVSVGCWPYGNRGIGPAIAGAGVGEVGKAPRFSRARKTDVADEEWHNTDQTFLDDHGRA